MKGVGLRFLWYVTLVGCLAYLPRAMAEMPSSLLIGGVFEYMIQPGDYLIKIGARFGVAAEVLARDNGLKYSAKLMPGQKLTVDNRHIVPELREDGLLINIPQRMLYYFHDWELAAAYPVGLGKPSWPTPAGGFSVIDKVANKTWRVPKSIQEEMRREGQAAKTEVPPGFDNPLGKYWLGLSLTSIGIHGTSAPASIYLFQSHGCIRLHPDDIEALFAQIERGVTGSIIYVPLLLTESEGRIFIEAHQDIYHKVDVSLSALEEMAQDAMLSDRIDWSRAADVLELKDGVARDVTLSSQTP
ncbi:putative L,D-transpeptidase YnhG precursor [mine drainage metagenome]|uniref:Putative L,D-transpeptidase YnhG n=1 Tax=mine drainage metagenome TaxID=410659 RepID=A0A1J5RKL4_9ZZZZ